MSDILLHQQYLFSLVILGSHPAPSHNMVRSKAPESRKMCASKEPRQWIIKSSKSNVQDVGRERTRLGRGARVNGINGGVPASHFIKGCDMKKIEERFSEPNHSTQWPNGQTRPRSSSHSNIYCIHSAQEQLLHYLLLQTKNKMGALIFSYIHQNESRCRTRRER